MYYELHEFNDNGVITIHHLESENIVDIKSCLHMINELRKAKRNNDLKHNINYMASLECLPETIQKVAKITIPATDY